MGQFSISMLVFILRDIPTQCIACLPGRETHRLFVDRHSDGRATSMIMNATQLLKVYRPPEASRLSVVPAYREHLQLIVPFFRLLP